MKLPKVNWELMHQMYWKPNNDLRKAGEELRTGVPEGNARKDFLKCAEDLEEVARKYGTDIALSACVTLIVEMREIHQADLRLHPREKVPS